MNYQSLMQDMLDDIYRPDKRGIGAGINQSSENSTTASATITIKNNSNKNTIQSVLKNTGTAVNKTVKTGVTDTINQTIKASTANVEKSLGELTRELLTDKGGSVSINGVLNSVMKKTVDQIINDEIKKGSLSFQTSKLGTTIAKVRSYYKKLYDGDVIMLNLRNKAEKNITKAITQSLNDKLASWQKGLPNWQKRLLANSKLASSLQSFLKIQTQNCIKSIFGDSLISGINNKLLKNLTNIKDAIKTQFNTTFKGAIEYAAKLQKAIAEKIVQFQEMKKKFEQHISSIINEYKKKISEAIQNFTNKLVSTITSSIKVSLSGVKL